MKTIDLGCGGEKIEGAIGIDIKPGPGVDIVYDLNKFPYPFPDNEFDFVHCSHILEHLEKPFEVMKEIHRIAKPGAEVKIVTPHYSSHVAYADMTHHYRFGHTSFTWLCDHGLFEIKKTQIIFTDIYRIIGISLLANLFPRRWEKYLCFVFPALYLFEWLETKKK